jgi:spoIIIJ-associated protein
VRQGDNVVAEPDQEQHAPGQDEAAAGEAAADSAGAGTDDVIVATAADAVEDDAVEDDDDALDDDAVNDDPADEENGEAADAPAAGAGAGSGSTVADLELESEIAADYIEGLLDVADLDGDIDMDVEGERAFVSVVGATLDELVGQRGEVLEALQELTRLAVHRQTGQRTRMMLDVGGYRQRRRTELAETGRDAAAEVKRTGEPKRLWPMNPFERKIVHDAVADAGLRSESEGEEPDRRVIVLPAV